MKKETEALNKSFLLIFFVLSTFYFILLDFLCEKNIKSAIWLQKLDSQSR